MASDSKTKTFTAQVVENGEVVVPIDIPVQFNTATGFKLHSDNDMLVLRRGTVRLELANVVHIEDGEPARLFQVPLGVNPIPLELTLTNRRGTLRYRDTASAAAPFVPHKISITFYLR